MITEPDKAFVMGGTYRVPVLMGLLPRNFLNDLKNDSTFNEASFEREYKFLYSLNFVNCGEALRALTTKLLWGHNSGKVSDQGMVTLLKIG